MCLYLGKFPVVEPRTLQLGVVELEAERLDKVQRHAGVRAQPDDIASVRRDFGLEQDEVEHRSA